MSNTKKRGTTPLDQAWPQFKRDILKKLYKISPATYTLVRDNHSQHFTHIDFNFEIISKERIYKIIAEISFNSYANRNLKQLCWLLAKSTNLGANEDIKISANTIYRKVHKKKKYLKQIDNGNFIITTQQGHLPAHSNVGAGCGVNQNW